MNKNKDLLLIVPMCLVMAACQYAGRPGDLPPPNGPAVPDLVPCDRTNTDRDKTLTVVADEAHFSVAPPHLCIKRGRKITYRFISKSPAGTISLTAKSGSTPDWLAVSNPGGESPQEVTKEIGEGAIPKTYFYDVKAAGWGTIDPMITID